MARRTKKTLVAFEALSVEGALIAPAMLAKITLRETEGQKDADYWTKKGLVARDEIARFYRIGQALFREFSGAVAPQSVKTAKFVEALLTEVFEFGAIERPGTRSLDGHVYPVSLEALGGRVPVVVVPPSDDLDRVSDHLPSEDRRRSAASVIQDWLNANENALWGFCSNGLRLRLVRENPSLTRPAYIEADLRHIFESDGFADFATLWLLIHASRFGAVGAPVTDCALERWRDAGGKEGLAARDRLRDGVEAALLALGNGFLTENPDLRERVKVGQLALPEYFGQLLRLVYRLIFLLVAEERGLLHAPETAADARRLYSEGYSLLALREKAVRRSAWDRHHDRWEGLKIVFLALARGEPLLGLPALGGLFLPELTPDLNSIHLPNRALMEAIYRLAWLKDDSSLAPVNWRDMETEELGSVYESLLELTPRIADDARAFVFAEGAETRGHARKTTGSYYTPDSLVQNLLDSTLDPVLDRVERESDDPAEALLAVTAIDPACGSGHFLLAAARRIASRLARARAGGVAGAQEFRHALRDVARCCIHGVDRNPMAVELTKVALWIETVEPGKPLGFLDANIRCGDALLGVFDLEALRKGIPDEAYKPLAGDDRETARHFLVRNRGETTGQGSLDFGQGGGTLPAAPPLAETTQALRALPEDSPEEIFEKKRRFAAAEHDPRRWNWCIASDLFVAAFLTPKTGGVPANGNTVAIPTTAHVWQALAGLQVYNPLVGRAQDLAGAARAFHWPLEFPDVMASGGFDVVLGNPPWERPKLQEVEFFSTRDAEIAAAQTAAKRKSLIAALELSAPGSFQRKLLDEFLFHKRNSEASGIFFRASDRFPLSARGDVNSYALFSELFFNLLSNKGCAGILVPSGIATENATSAFFGSLSNQGQIKSFYDFENRAGFFHGLHTKHKFAAVSLTKERTKTLSLCFFIFDISDILDARKQISLTPEDICLFNPNTKTLPIIRSAEDLSLLKKLYNISSPLINRANNSNPWGATYQTLFHMSADSGLFQSESSNETYPLYEAKMFWLFDCRWANASEGSDDRINELSKVDPSLNANSRYFIQRNEVEKRLSSREWDRQWLIAFRNISDTRNERTFVSTAIPLCGVGHSATVLTINRKHLSKVACFIAISSSLVLDFAARQKIPGMNVSAYMVDQLPFLRPDQFTAADIAFVTPRVLELSYTSHSMAPFAHDLHFDGPPFIWDEDRRALLRAELDAFCARAYGLTRDELRYILDPADVKGADYPSETFRVLKSNEIRKFGEYRTGRLVLDAWDRMERGELAPEASSNLVALPTSLHQSQPVLDLNALTADDWARPMSNPLGETMETLAAVLKALPHPLPAQRVRLAALLTLEPYLLGPHLSGDRAAQWRRVVGGEVAGPPPDSSELDAHWGATLRHFRSHGWLDESNGNWAPSNRLDTLSVGEWAKGRAAVVLDAMRQIGDSADIINLFSAQLGRRIYAEAA